MTSIRKKLLWRLIALFILVWGLVGSATYYTAQHEVEEVFDAQLAQTAKMIGQLAVANLDSHGAAIEKPDILTVAGHKYERYISYQIWYKNILLLRSATAPDTPLSTSTGFQDVDFNQQRWRVYGLHPAKDFRVFTGETHKARDELSLGIVVNLLEALLWALPVMAILIWLSVGHGLAPLQQVANIVAARNARQLSPVPDQHTPDEIKPLTGAINELLSQLSLALEKERRFTADASHELRTPLASIRVQAQLANSTDDDNERQRCLSNVITGIDKTAHLVEQMLTLAQLEPEAITQHQRQCDFCAIAKEIISEHQTTTTKPQLQITLNGRCNGNAAFMLQTDEALIRILLRNLLDNAIHYATDAKQVDISISQSDDDSIILAVSDDGCGIANDQIERVMDRFYRPPGQAQKGSGLGFSIVQRIVSLLDGDISLQHNTPQGLRVTIRFASTQDLLGLDLNPLTH